MPNWKKVLVSGSAVEVRHLTASGNIQANGETHVFGGDVGIGTQSPGEQLEVYANGAAVAIKIHEDAGTHQAKLHLRRGGSDWEIINDNHLSIEGEGSERLRIDTAGDVGINVTNPTEKLHIGGNVRTNTTQGYYGSFIQAISNAGMKIGNDNYSGFAFFNDDGNTGIGTENPTKALQVEGDISASGDISFEGTILSASFGGAIRGSDASPIVFGDDIRIQDNVELRFGTGPSSGATTDFKILHDGTDNHLTATIGAINIEGNGGAVNISQMGNGQGINLIPNHNPSNPSIGSSGTVLISGSAQSLNGIRLDVRGDISSSATVIADEFKLANGAFSVDTSGDITTANDFTAGNSAANDTHQITGKTRFDGHVTSSAGSNISASATSTITAGVGAFVELHGVGTETSLEVDGPITGSAFQGTKHILKAASFYINDDPMIQNSLYFGGNLGHQNSNWNDPQAVGGAISSTANFDIAEDDMNWGYILPFDISGVEVQCSLRPAGGGSVTGDDFSLAIYTANRSNDSNTNITLTKVAHQSDTFNNANYATNDLTYTGNLDKGSMIFVGVGSETSGTPAKNARGLMNITIVAR